MLQDILTTAADTLANGFAAIDPEIGQTYGGLDYSSLQFLGVPVFEPVSIIHLLFRFAFTMLVSWIIVHFCYYPKSKRQDYYFTFLIFSATMFLLIFLMENVSMQIGFTLGLFAIFGMIRYRTETVPIREMTYLFVIIGISVMNGLAMTVSYTELVLTNALLIALIAVLESRRIFRFSASKMILYEKIELIVPERREEMIADLRKRTGLDIKKVEIGHIDFLRDVAMVKVHYYVGKEGYSSIENIDKLRDFRENQ